MNVMQNKPLVVLLSAVAILGIALGGLYLFVDFADLKETLENPEKQGRFRWWIDMLKKNKILLSMLWVGLFSSVTGCFYYLFWQFWDWLSQKFSISVSLDNTEESFTWVVNYLGKHPEFFMTAPTLKVNLIKANKQNSIFSSKIGGEDISKDRVQFVPGNGKHIIKYKKKLMWFSRFSAPDGLITTGWENKPFILETLHLSCFGTDPTIVKELFHDAMLDSLEQHRDKVKIYVLGRWWGWEMALARSRRPMDSVVLHGDTANELLEDVRTFLKRGDWYRDHGIPFRRGYLLYGVPGTGKSSLIVALASALQFNICLLTLSSGLLDDRTLNDRLHEAPENSIILMEDIDAIFVDRNTPSEKEGPGGARKCVVTFSGFLNAIDGIAAQEGKIIFMTTNHIEKLDPALLRCGRCDVKKEFGYATKNQAGRLFKRFYPKCSDDAVEQFKAEIPSGTLVMAAIQGHLLHNKGDPKKAIKDVQKLIDSANVEESHNDLPIGPWLKRLGLYHHYNTFKKQRVYTPFDLQPANPNILMQSYKMTKYMEKKRIMSMMMGDKLMKKEFTLATQAEIGRIYRSIRKGVHEKEIHELVDMIPNEEISVLALKCFLYRYSVGFRKITHEKMLGKVKDELLEPKPYIAVKEVKDEKVSTWIQRQVDEKDFKYEMVSVEKKPEKKEEDKDKDKKKEDKDAEKKEEGKDDEKKEEGKDDEKKKETDVEKVDKKVDKKGKEEKSDAEDKEKDSEKEKKDEDKKEDAEKEKKDEDKKEDDKHDEEKKDDDKKDDDKKKDEEKKEEKKPKPKEYEQKKFLDILTEHGIHTTRQLSKIGAGDLSEYKISKKGQQLRIMKYLSKLTADFTAYDAAMEALKDN